VTRLKVGFYSFGGCEGCSYELLNLDEALLKALEELQIDIAYSVVLGAPTESSEYDVAFVEGSIASEEDLEKLRALRKKTKVLVAMGTCAALGGIPGLKRFADKDAVKTVYGSVDLEHKSLDEASPLSRFVQVDYHLRGCPVNKSEFLELVLKVAKGRWLKQSERRFDYGREAPSNIEGTAVELDGEKCYVCGRCVKVCEAITSAIDYANRSVDTIISTPFKVKFDESLCISCGQCTAYCPVGAIKERSHVTQVQRILKTREDLVAYVEPEVIAGFSEATGINGDAGGKLASALRRLGFNKVYLWKPDLSPKRRGGLSIVPASEAERRYVDFFYPDLAANVLNPPRIDGNDAVWFTPCVARKLGGENILTTRELIRLLGPMEVSLLPAGKFDKMVLPKESKGVTVATGISEMRNVLEKVRNKQVTKGTIILYVCEGGCIQGGGQPYNEPGSETKRNEILTQLIS
jgi:coenzyme F420-reducing hydrogenase gamma subunit